MQFLCNFLTLSREIACLGTQAIHEVREKLQKQMQKQNTLWKKKMIKGTAWSDVSYWCWHKEKQWNLFIFSEASTDLSFSKVYVEVANKADRYQDSKDSIDHAILAEKNQKQI